MLCFTFLSWVSAAVLGLLPCSAMLVSLITGLLSLYFTMVQSPPSPALLHIPPPATVKYSGCLAAAAAAQLPVSFTPVLRLTAACSLVTAQPRPLLQILRPRVPLQVACSCRVQLVCRIVSVCN